MASEGNSEKNKNVVRRPYSDPTRELQKQMT